MNLPKVVILGLGRIGRIHLRNLVFSGRPAVPVVVTSSSSGRQFAASLGLRAVYPTLEEAMQKEDPDAVVICSPSDTHYRYVKFLIEAKKAIFCEKPLDLSVAAIEELDRLARQGNVPLMVAFNRRFDPSFSKLRQEIKAGKAGDLRLIRITGRDPAPPSIEFLRSSGGIFLDQVIHDFDMVRFLTGDEVVEVYAKADVKVDKRIGEIGDWDTAVSVLTLRGGATAVIDNSREAVYGYDQRAEVFGSGGMLKVDNLFPHQVNYHFEHGSQAPRPYNFFLDRYAASYRAELDRFLDVLTEGASVPVTAVDALAATKIALAAAESARTNRPVRLGEI